MKFEDPSLIPPEEHPGAEGENAIRKQLIFPHVKAITALLDKAFEGAEKEDKLKYEADRKAVEDILWAFIEQRIERAGVYRSEKHNVAFPYGVTDTAELAKKLYTQYAGPEYHEAQLEENDGEKTKEFVFTSVPPIQTISAGSLFAFMEESMHYAIKDLPGALAALKAGKDPDAHEIYNVGSPTNKLGTMSPEFLKNMEDKGAFKEFGALYAEFIASTIPPEERANTRIFLYGQSEGASFAAETGAKLIEDGAATQSHDIESKKRIPFMQVRLDMPVGASKNASPFKISAGFIADGGFTTMVPSALVEKLRKIVPKKLIDVTDEDMEGIRSANDYLMPVMKEDAAFQSSAQKLFDKKEMPENLSKEQVRLKNEGAWQVFKDLIKDTPIPKGLKVTKVVGGNDLLMWSNEAREKMDVQKAQHGGSLGENIISSGENGNERTFGIKSMRHTPPYFRPNELKRLAGAARALKSVGGE